MSIYAIAMLYAGRKLDKVRLFNTETEKVELIDPAKLKSQMKKNEIIIPNLVLDGTKFASKGGNPPRVTKVIDGNFTSPVYRTAILKIGELGYKYVNYEGATYLLTMDDMKEYAGVDSFSNISINYSYGELEITPLYGDIVEGTSGNRVKAVGYNADGTLRGYCLDLNGREDFSNDISSLKNKMLENADIQIKETKENRRRFYSLDLTEECPKVYLVPEDFYKSVYGKAPNKHMTALGWCAVLSQEELRDIQQKSGIFDINTYCRLSDVSSINDKTANFVPVVKEVLNKSLNNEVLSKINFVNSKKGEDEAKSPWGSDKWGKKFLQANKSGSMQFKDAPCNTLLMTTEYEFGTVCESGRDRGTGLDMYSVIIKLSDDLIYCVKGSYWGVSSSGTSSYSFGQRGFYDVWKEARGTVKLIGDVDILDGKPKPDNGADIVPLRTRESMTDFAEYLTSKYKSQGFKMHVAGTDDNLHICVRYVGDPNVTELRIPEGVTSLSRMSLVKATNLTRIHLPSTLEQVGEALNLLPGLSIITSDSKKTFVFVEDNVVFENTNSGVRLRFYPRTCKNSFYSVPEFVTSIADSAFMGNPYIQIIDIKNKVTVNNKCFSGCTSLREITFRNIKLADGKFMFKGTKFESVRLENGYSVQLGMETFSDCPELMFAMFSDVDVIGNQSFVNCPKLSTLVFCNICRFKVSPRDAFSNCPMLKTVYLPDFMRGTDIAQNFESAYTVEYYNTDCNDSFGRIAHTIMHKDENQSIVHAGDVVSESDKGILATGVEDITNLSVKAYKVSYLRYNGAIVGYRLTLEDLTRRDISKEIGDTLDFGSYKIQYSINLVQDGDELISQTEKTTGNRVRDISDDIKLCQHYAKDIRELS